MPDNVTHVVGDYLSVNATDSTVQVGAEGTGVVLGTSGSIKSGTSSGRTQNVVLASYTNLNFVNGIFVSAT